MKQLHRKIVITLIILLLAISGFFILEIVKKNNLEREMEEFGEDMGEVMEFDGAMEGADTGIEEEIEDFD